MLVLSRYRDESIYIGDDIVITVVDIRGDRVRIGVQAPTDVSVHRKEVYEAIQTGKQREPGAPPLSRELNKRKARLENNGKAIPFSADTMAEFGGFTSDSPVVS